MTRDGVRQSARSRLGRFIADERASFSIEFLLWLPLFIFVLGAIVDASCLFQVHADMWTVARDGALRMSMAEMNAQEAETFATRALADVSTFSFFVDAYEQGSGSDVYSTVSITVPVEDVSVFRLFAGLLYEDLIATVSMRYRIFPT